MPPSPASSSFVPLVWPADIRAGQPLVWNFDTADRLLRELADNEPLQSLEEIIESVRAELEATFITPEGAAMAVIAVAATTATTTTRRRTRARRAPKRFAPTPSTRPHHYEVAAIHGCFQVGLVDYFLVSWVGYDADWMWLPECELTFQVLNTTQLN